MPELTREECAEICAFLGIEKSWHTWPHSDTQTVSKWGYPPLLTGDGLLLMLEKLREREFHLTLSDHPQGYMVEMWPAHDVEYGTGETAPLAVARAVLALARAK